MHAVIILGRQVNSGELTAHEYCCALRVTAQQFDRAEAVTLGLKDPALFNFTQLADCAIGRAEHGARAAVERAGAIFQGAGKKVIEVSKSSQVFNLGFFHVDVVLLGEPADQAILEPVGAAFGGTANQARQ